MSVLPQARLLELDRQLHARPDAMPEITMHDYSIRIYDDRLFIVPTGSPEQAGGEYDFGLKQDIEIEAFRFQLKRSAVFEQLEIPDRDQALTLKFRGQNQQSQDAHVNSARRNSAHVSHTNVSPRHQSRRYRSAGRTWLGMG